MRYGDPFNDGQITRESILEFVNNRRMKAEDTYRPFFAKTKVWYNTYRGIVSGKSFSHRNDLAVPALFSQIMSDVAAKAQALFGDQDIVQFQPVSSQDGMIARKNSLLVNLQLADCNTYVKGVDFLLSASVYGTGIARLSWKFEQRIKLYRAKVLDQEIVVRNNQTLFDGPWWDVVDILDFLPEPGKTRLEDCTWVIHTYYTDLDQILEAQHSSGTPMFDEEGIKQLMDSPMQPELREAWKSRMTTYRTATDMNSRLLMPFSRPVRIDEYWGLVPREMGINGDRNLVITVANGKAILRYEPNPFWDGQIPFLVYTPMPDMHALHGTGKAEIAEKTQNIINRLANIKLDALELFAAPMFFVKDNAGIDGQSLIARPGRLFPMQADDMRAAVMPVSPDVRALNMLYTEMQQVSMFQQQGLGIDDSAIQGMEAPDRETAHGFQGRRDAAMSRLASEAELAGRMFVEPLAQWFRRANRQLLELPKQIQRIGQDAVIDPATGFPIPQQTESVQYPDLVPDYHCRAMGGTRMLGRTVMANQMATFIQTAGAVQPAAMMTNWAGAIKAYAMALGLDPLQILIQTQPPMVNQIADQTGADPNSMLQAMASGQPVMGGTAPGAVPGTEGGPVGVTQ